MNALLIYKGPLKDNDFDYINKLLKITDDLGCTTNVSMTVDAKPHLKMPSRSAQNHTLPGRPHSSSEDPTCSAAATNRRPADTSKIRAGRSKQNREGQGHVGAGTEWHQVTTTQ